MRRTINIGHLLMILLASTFFMMEPRSLATESESSEKIEIVEKEACFQNKYQQRQLPGKSNFSVNNSSFVGHPKGEYWFRKNQQLLYLLHCQLLTYG
jgi:hypothetical protein